MFYPPKGIALALTQLVFIDFSFQLLLPLVNKKLMSQFLICNPPKILGFLCSPSVWVYGQMDAVQGKKSAVTYWATAFFLFGFFPLVTAVYFPHQNKKLQLPIEFFFLHFCTSCGEDTLLFQKLPIFIHTLGLRYGCGNYENKTQSDFNVGNR